MDYNQPNCKNYFNLNTNTFYYEPPPLSGPNDSLPMESRQKVFNSESSFLESSLNQPDHSLRQPPYCDHAVVYTNLDDKGDFYVLNNRPFDAHQHPPAAQLAIQPTGYPANLQMQHPPHYPPIHSGPAADQTDSTNSVLFTNNQPNQLQTAAQFAGVPAPGGLQPLHHSSVQLPHPAPNQIGQTTSQAPAAQPTTKQLSVNLSMNMTMDIKSMDFKPTQNSSNQSDYNHVMNDVVSNVANKLVTNFNSNLLSPNAGSSQKDYPLYAHPSSYASATKTHHQYPFYNQNHNPNHYNQRYHNSACYTNEPAAPNHHLLNQYANGGPFDELAQFKHFNHLQLNNNDCYELVSYNQNWSESNNSSSLTTLTSSSLASNNLGSLNSSFSNGSLASNEINDNDYLINYSNNFLNSISVDSKSIGLAESGEKELRSKRKLQQLNNLTNTSYLSNGLEPDNQKIYFKIENNEIRSSRDKQDLGGVLKSRPNSQTLHRLERGGREIDLYPCNNKLDKKVKSVDGKNGNLCLLCGKSYARPSTLKTHLRTHSNERPFRCSTCFKSFSQAANLTAHQRVHSGK